MVKKIISICAAGMIVASCSPKKDNSSADRSVNH